MTSPAGPFSGPPPYDLRGCDLSRMNLGGKDLTNAKLQDSTLLGTVFNGVLSLAGADLSGAVMGNGTDFTGCDLSKVNFGANPRFGGSPYALTKFVGATLPQPALGLNWAYLDLTDAVVTGLPPNRDLSRLAVKNSNLVGFNFAGCTLSNAHFEGVALPGANFAKATLTGARFESALNMRCDLTGANFTHSIMDSGSLADCVLSRADFSDAKLGQVSFAGSAVDGTRFDRTDLTKCALTGVVRSTNRNNLTSLRGASLRWQSLMTAWSYLDLTDANIVGLARAIDEGAGLALQAQYSVLSGLDLSRAILTGSNLTGTTLAGTNFTGARLERAEMWGVRSVYEIFRVGGSEYDELLSALETRTVKTVSRIFGTHGYPVAPDGTTISAEAGTDRGWIVTDPSVRPALTYLVAAGTAGCLVVTNLGRVALFDGANLTGAKLAPDKGVRTVLRGASFNGATLEGADLTQADLGPVDPHNPATGTRFVGAKMDRVALSQAVLTGAKLVGAFLHGANLAGAAMKGADLSGAQLGSLAPQFAVPENSAHYRALLTALDRADADGVSEILRSYRHVGSADCEIKTLVPQRSWQVGGQVSKDPYTVLHWTSSTGERSLIVAGASTAATLTGAYLPNARLTDANLNGVAASGLQLYGDVRLDGAILDGAILSHANLAGSHLGVKALHHVDLSYANLINSSITGVDLTNGVVLSYACLQGTDFTDCHLNSANLEYAAVSVKLSGTVSGTYLFKVPNAASSAFKDAVAELTAASDPMFPVELAPGPDRTPVDQLVGYLRQGDVTNVGPILVKRGLALPAGAKIQSTAETNAWQIIDSKESGFNIWLGSTRTGAKVVFARPGTPKLQQFFKTNSASAGVLRWQSTISRTAEAPNRWAIDNDSANPDNPQLGYVKILVVRSDDDLLFYGTSLRIERLTDDNTRQIVPVTLVPTVLGPKDASGEQQCGPYGAGSYFGPDTVCPNAAKLSANQNGKTTVRWEEMLRAPAPPAPPPCVPSPNQFCPPVSAAGYATGLPEPVEQP